MITDEQIKAFTDNYMKDNPACSDMVAYGAKAIRNMMTAEIETILMECAMRSKEEIQSNGFRRTSIDVSTFVELFKQHGYEPDYPF